MKLFNKNKADRPKGKHAPKEKKEKPEKVSVKKIGLRRKSVFALWLLLIGSVAFGVYKNYTAVDTRTEVIEKTVEMKLLDTNALETYVVNFAKIYHAWSKKKEDLDGRMQNLGNYMSESLLLVNTGLLDDTTVTDATVQEVQVWNVKGVDGMENEYRVVYSVKQKVTSYLERASKDKKKKKKETEKTEVYQTNTFETKVYVDEIGNLLIVSNPTICSIPKKSKDAWENIAADGSVDSTVMKEVTEFLETFFALYPAATEKELVYYVKDGLLKPLDGKYTYWEVQNPIFTEGKGDNVRVNFYVKYFDEISQTPQISQYDFTLEKGDNWKIIKVH
ncbi:conjugal transfer protein [Robinsoniella peoriensis]|uniref:Conjugative transposon protein TcpC n=1 Tax=Robinsoniella peoriensis TaxID=180332 RepID=A0A4U8QBA6_9FIRM|nr:conjugal transfer protein [Robinsoniella peoriensis]TLC99165.1 Conjugative transposon protein TcpC [Robinsoniella peoriensis]